MEVKLGYKQTEVGVIPEDWQCAPMSSIARLESGHTPSKREPSYWGGSVGWVSLHDTESLDGPEITTTAQTITDEGLNNSSARLLPKGTVVFSRTATVGKTTTLGREMATSQDFAAYICGPQLHNHFLVYLFRSMGRTWQSLMAGSIHNTIYMPVFKALKIALPPTAEQLAIAEALNDVDALLGGLDRLITKKRDLKQAAMQQLLTGQTRLKGFGPTRSFKRYAYGIIPDDWHILPISRISTMNGRIGWQGLKQDEFTDNPDDPFLITGMNFKDGKIRWDEVYHIPPKRYREAPAIQLKPEDILITKDGTIGKLLFVEEIPYPGLASLNSHLLVFRPIEEQYVPKFLFYHLDSPPFARHIELHKSGSTFFGLTQAATGKYPVVLPSLAEQTAIAAVLTEIDDELAALEQRREKTRALKQAMMQELLTGRIRLI